MDGNERLVTEYIWGLKDSESSEWFLEEVPKSYAKEKDFVSLVAWKRCRELRRFFYEAVIPLLPPEEKYALSNQIRRAAQSITLNIAEGYGRFHYKEGIQFYRIARGSIYELKDALIICWDLKILDRPTLEAFWVLAFRGQRRDFWVLASEFCEEYRGIPSKIGADRFQEAKFGP